MIVTKDIDKKVFDYIDPWGEILTSIAWVLRASYQFTLGSTPSQALLVIDMIFNATPVVYWRFITAKKQQKIDIYNVRKNARQVSHDYALSYLVYVKMTVV